MIHGSEEWLKKHFERNQDNTGWLAYKIFNSSRLAPETWIIEKDSILTDDQLNFNVFDDCGAGINVAWSVRWIEEFISDQFQDWHGNDEADVWLVLIPDDANLIVPQYSDGKIRCDKLILLETIGTVQYYNDPDYGDDYFDDDEICWDCGYLIEDCTCDNEDDEEETE